MTKKVFINQADIRRLAVIAKEFGIRVELEADGVIIRFSPDRPDAFAGYRDPGIDYSPPEL